MALSHLRVGLLVVYLYGLIWTCMDLYGLVWTCMEIRIEQAAVLTVDQDSSCRQGDLPTAPIVVLFEPLPRTCVRFLAD